jgi:stage III sporulation protein AA
MQETKTMNLMTKYFPKHIKEALENNISEEEVNIIEEIRIRINLPIIVKLAEKEKIIDYKVSTEDINYIFQKICENSIYAYQNQIANGFVTIKGGNRVGIVGTAVVQNGKVTNLNYVSGLNFRIAQEIIGCSNKIVSNIIRGETIYNTLIIAMPGMGKTTLLRDIIRNLSNGFTDGNTKIKGQNISVIDERGEISATYRGGSQNDLGIRTDVLNDIPKAIGMKMAIRSMAPQIIAADEIGSVDDVNAIQYAICCGIKGIFTAHGNSVEDVKKNTELKSLIDNKIFEKFIIIKKEDGRRKIIVE